MTLVKFQQCINCDITNKVLPIRFKYGFCNKCLRDKCIELIEEGKFKEEVLEKNYNLAVSMLTSLKEYEERNPKYDILDCQTKKQIEEWFELLL